MRAPRALASLAAHRIKTRQSSERAGVIRVEGTPLHGRGGRSLTIIVDSDVRADLFSEIQAGRVVLYPAHLRGIHPFGADTVEYQLARLIVAEVAHPSGGETEAGEGDG